MVPHFATAEEIIMSVHALVVDTPSQRIIVDTCIGNDKSRSIYSEPSPASLLGGPGEGGLPERNHRYRTLHAPSIMSVETRC